MFNNQSFVGVEFHEARHDVMRDADPEFGFEALSYEHGVVNVSSSLLLALDFVGFFGEIRSGRVPWMNNRFLVLTDPASFQSESIGGHSTLQQTSSCFLLSALALSLAGAASRGPRARNKLRDFTPDPKDAFSLEAGARGCSRLLEVPSECFLARGRIGRGFLGGFLHLVVGLSRGVDDRAIVNG